MFSKLFGLPFLLCTGCYILDRIINGTKVKYCFYRINKTSYVLGSCHINNNKSIIDDIKSYIFNCKKLLCESYSIRTKSDAELVLSYDMEKLMLNVKIDLNVKKGESIISPHMMYKGEFLKKLFQFEGRELYLNEIMYKQRALWEFISVDNFFACKFLSMSKKIIELDNSINIDKEVEPCEKEVKNKGAEEVKYMDENTQKALEELKEAEIIAEKILMMIDIIKNPFSFFNFINAEYGFSNFTIKILTGFSKLINKYLNVDFFSSSGRNKIWVPKIEKEINEDDCFICVGAAHIDDLVQKLKQKYVIEKYNYRTKKFEEMD